MIENLYRKKKLVLTITICALLAAVGFSSVIADPPPVKGPYDDDWDYWGNPPHMFSNVSGNVGIGTETPGEKLVVNGKVQAVSFIGDGSELTGIVCSETDPIYSGDPASGISSGDITNWNTAYGWGDHSIQGYLTSYTETDPTVLASVKDGIDWSEISSIPSDIADGDDDTTYSAGFGLDLIGNSFSVDQTEFQQRVINSCPPGYSIRAINEDGTCICEFDDDTTLTESQVDAYANNNGYLTIETDPVFISSPANTITSTYISNWNYAFSNYDQTIDSWTGSTNVYTPYSVGIGIPGPSEKLDVSNNIALGSSNPADDDYLYFDAKAEFLRWIESSKRFELSDDLHVYGEVTWTTKTSNLSVSAAAFRPRNNGQSYDNQGNILQTTSAGSYYAPVQLPHGATITKVTFYWTDSDSINNGRITLYRNFFTGYNGMATVLTNDGGSGISSTKTITTPVVDNSANSYYIEMYLPSNTVVGRGVIIEYTITEPY